MLEYNINYLINEITISPNGQTLAVTNDKGQLLVFQVDGKVLFEETVQNKKDMYCNTCLFSSDGTQLWNIIETENQQVQIQYRDTERWQVLKRAVLLDGDSYSSFFLTPHPENKVLAVWETSGQHGCWLYWIWDDGEMRVLKAPELEEKILPKFHHSGGEFLVVDDLGELYRYRFPDCHLMGTATLDVEEDYFDCYIGYLSDERAIVKSENYRVFIVDLKSMKVVDEVILEGYEPRPTHEIFPKLADESSICGNLSYFKRVGQDRIVSVHFDYKEHRNTLLLWGGNLLFGKCTQPSSLAPYTAQFNKIANR